MFDVFRVLLAGRIGWNLGFALFVPQHKTSKIDREFSRPVSHNTSLWKVITNSCPGEGLMFFAADI